MRENLWEKGEEKKEREEVRSSEKEQKEKEKEGYLPDKTVFVVVKKMGKTRSNGKKGERRKTCKSKKGPYISSLPPAHLHPELLKEQWIPP